MNSSRSILGVREGILLNKMIDDHESHSILRSLAVWKEEPNKIKLLNQTHLEQYLVSTIEADNISEYAVSLLIDKPHVIRKYYKEIIEGVIDGKLPVDYLSVVFDLYEWSEATIPVLSMMNLTYLTQEGYDSLQKFKSALDNRYQKFIDQFNPSLSTLKGVKIF